MRVLTCTLGLLLLLAGCGKNEDEDMTASCSFEEEHFGGSYNVLVSPGEKIAQRFQIVQDHKLT